MAARNWSRDELVLAFNLYCKIPFGRIHNRNPEIIALARILGRTPSSVSWKLANFASLDPALKDRHIAGASHGGKLDAEIWGEFSGDWDALAYQTERLLAKRSGKTVESLAGIDKDDLPKEGKERQALVKIRVNQSFFRLAVLAAYNYRCCITGLPIPELLIASHIVPWSKDKANRVNPRNGLCLNALHDRAFDSGYLTITPDFKVRVSPIIRKFSAKPPVVDFIARFDGTDIALPDRFLPDPSFLTFHNLSVFRRR